MTGSGGFTWDSPNTLILSGNNTYAGSTVVNGGTLALTGSLATSYKSPANQLIAAPDETLSGNPVLSFRVAESANYNPGDYANDEGLGSRAVSTDSLVTNTSLDTTAAILAGTASSTQDVTMQWRQRTAAEAAASNPNAVLSDVVNLNGTGSDVFLLQMSYSDAALNALGLNENSIALSGELRLGWFDTLDSSWKSAVEGNSGGSPAFEGTVSAANFLSFLDTNSILLADKLGSYGVDPTSGTVWAILNHNSEFAVIPEPSTWVAGGVAVLGLALFQLRRRRFAANIA